MDGILRSIEAARERARPKRYWLHLLLLVLTLMSTTVVGAGLAQSFREGRPFNFDTDLAGWTEMFHAPALLLPGLPFSLTLLLVLLAHEFGHYFACRYYGVDATLPYFIPAPTLIGTLGAFIRIRSPIYSKRVLFDIGIAGPLAGFAALLAPLIAGVALSKVVPDLGAHGELVFGRPLIERIVEWIFFPGVAATHLYLHPIARAAWVGLLATALNLLPIGQLDGGHILYSFVGEWSKVLSRLFVVALIPLGFFFSYSWLVWAALLFFFGMRHPAIYDPSRLGPVRTRLGWVALVILLLSFTLAPIQMSGGL